ncbi:MAG: metal-dependent hydrolase [Gammaproteobacteria bacterium]|nr:metal-dependent hydrolase [Gammaproteobacteria bacterium]
MDPVSQFTLGAAVGLSVLGRRAGARRSALIGGVLGTLPDLDYLLPTKDAVDTYLSHRSATHSLLVEAAATPLIGEAVRLLVAPLRDARWLVWLAVYLCLATHALLDAVTVYGTRLFWPLSEEALGLGSLFIIDPLYTLPLLAVTIWALFRRQMTRRLATGVAASLALSTGYIAWSAVAQQVAASRGASHLAAQDIDPERLLATPAPFNTLLWRVIAVDHTRNYNVYVPLLGGDGAIIAHAYDRWPAEMPCRDREALAGDATVRELAAFTDGFYQIRSHNGGAVFVDLRMGLAPDYAFRFDVTTWSDAAERMTTEQMRAQPLRDDIGWLLRGIAGQRVLRPAERAHLLEDAPASPRAC